MIWNIILFYSSKWVYDILLVGSKHGSRTRLRLMKISFIVMRLLVQISDQKASDSLINVPNRFCNQIILSIIRLWGCLQTYRITWHTLNKTVQSWLFEMHILNYISGFSSCSKFSNAIYSIFFNWIISVRSSINNDE